MEPEHTQSHTAGGGVKETASTMAATTGIRPMRKPAIIGAGKLQDMNNVEYNATIFEAISDEKGASDEVHWEYDVTFFNPDVDAIINTTVTWNNSRVDKWIDDVNSDHTYAWKRQGEEVSQNWDAFLLNQLQVLFGTFAAYVSNEVGRHLYHSKCCLGLPN